MTSLRQRVLALTVLSITLAAGGARASDPAYPERIGHQISSMEKSLDHLLLDSPNFLIQRGPNAHGVYLSDHGLVLTFNAQLNANDSFVEVFDNEDDSRVVIRSRHGHHHGSRLMQGLFGVHVGSHGHQDDAWELYQDGKSELMELLLDQAGTLSSLPAGQWIVLSGHVNDDTLREEKKISRLVLRVRTDDLKAYADRKLSDEEATAKIVVEES
jgi:hypothetical protein